VNRQKKQFEDEIFSGIFNPNIPATATNNFLHMKIRNRRKRDRVIGQGGQYRGKRK
jgi:hypothetical protein